MSASYRHSFAIGKRNGILLNRTDQFQIYGKASVAWNKIRGKPFQKLVNFFRSTIWHQATFTKLSVLKELGGYDENLKITSDWKFIFLALVLHHKSYQALPIDISVFDTYGMSGASDANLIIQKEKTDVLKTYFPYFYPDYITLHRYKHLSFNHIKNTISYFLFKLMRKLNFK